MQACTRHATSCQCRRRHYAFRSTAVAFASKSAPSPHRRATDRRNPPHRPLSSAGWGGALAVPGSQIDADASEQASACSLSHARSLARRLGGCAGCLLTTHRVYVHRKHACHTCTHHPAGEARQTGTLEINALSRSSVSRLHQHQHHVVTSPLRHRLHALPQQ